jgi:hypothetical protein
VDAVVGVTSDDGHSGQRHSVAEQSTRIDIGKVRLIKAYMRLYQCTYAYVLEDVKTCDDAGALPPRSNVARVRIHYG